MKKNLKYLRYLLIFQNFVSLNVWLLRILCKFVNVGKTINIFSHKMFKLQVEPDELYLESFSKIQ